MSAACNKDGRLERNSLISTMTYSIGRDQQSLRRPESKSFTRAGSIVVAPPAFRELILLMLRARLSI
jgi:hypothetical protein